jgi:hypothetical protein
VADLTERGDVERVVELAVPVRVQPMPENTAARDTHSTIKALCADAGEA